MSSAKREHSVAARRTPGTSRTASRYRGVTHHSRTNRYEAHVWSEGKQVYLGGFGLESQAATAYDLAACRFRGQDAHTNFPMSRYAAELDDGESAREDVVQALRTQSKAMNFVVADPAVALEPWEIEISSFVHPDKQSLGVYPDERAAAVAVDSALVCRNGLEAPTVFPITDYVHLMGDELVQEGIRRGALPSDAGELAASRRRQLEAQVRRTAEARADADAARASLYAAPTIAPARHAPFATSASFGSGGAAVAPTFGGVADPSLLGFGATRHSPGLEFASLGSEFAQLRAELAGLWQQRTARPADFGVDDRPADSSRSAGPVVRRAPSPASLPLPTHARPPTRTGSISRRLSLHVPVSSNLEAAADAVAAGAATLALDSDAVPDRNRQGRTTDGSDYAEPSTIPRRPSVTPRSVFDFIEGARAPLIGTKRAREDEPTSGCAPDDFIGTWSTDRSS